MVSRDDAAYRFIEYEKQREPHPFKPNRRIRAFAIVMLVLGLHQLARAAAQSQVLMCLIFGLLLVPLAVIALRRPAPPVRIEGKELCFVSPFGFVARRYPLSSIVRAEARDTLVLVGRDGAETQVKPASAFSRTGVEALACHLNEQVLNS